MATTTDHQDRQSGPPHRSPASTIAVAVAVVLTALGATTCITAPHAGAAPISATSSSVPPGTITTFGHGLNATGSIAAGPDGNLWVAIGTGIARVSTAGAVTIFPGKATIDVAGAPDGTVWFTSAQGVGRITTTGTYSYFPGALPGAVINAGPDGNMWTSTTTTLNRITPAGVVTTFTDPSMTSVRDFAFDDAGNVWFEQNTQTATVGRLTPAGTVSSFTLPAVGMIGGIARGADGSIWAAWADYQAYPDAIPGGVAQVAADGTMTLHPGGPVINRLASGADGSFWGLVDDRHYSMTGAQYLDSVGGIYKYSSAGDATGTRVWQPRRALPADSFPDATVTGPSSDLVAGPDGNMWFVGGNTVNRANPDGTNTSFNGTDVNNPTGLALGPDGALWFANEGYDFEYAFGADSAIGSIGRRTTAGTVTSFRNTNVVNPNSIVQGPDGKMWFADKATGKIGHIDASGTVTTFAQGPGLHRPRSLTRGADGNLWFIDAGSSRVGRITTTGTYTTWAAPGVWDRSTIVSGPDGNLWFTATASKIGRITTAGTITMFTSPRSDLRTDTITSGPDGNLWFTNLKAPAGSTAIGRLTTAGVFTFHDDANLRNPTAITRGPDGNVWFTNGGLGRDPSATIGRITPSGAITWFSSPDVPDAAGIVAGNNGDLWFSTGFHYSLGHITATAVDAPNAAAFPAATSRPDGAQVSWWPAAPSVGVTGGFVTPHLNGVPLEPTAFTGNPASVIVAGLTSGWTYTFTVSLTNASGTGRPSAITAPVTVGRPVTPGFVSAAPAAGAGTATVSWWSQPVTSGVITPYLGTVAQAPVPFTGQRSSHVVNGLTAGQTYTFTVTLTNPYGTSPASAKSNTVTIGVPVVGFPGASAGPSGVTVSWWPQPITGGVITPYLGGVAQTPVPFTGNVNNRLITGLTAGQSYRFTIMLTNANGTGPPSAQTTAVTVIG